MSILGSVLREKRLRRMQRLQELALAQARRDESRRTAAATRQAQEQAHALLWEAMTSEELCVQRLSIARAEEHAAARAAHAAKSQHESDTTRLQEAERSLVRAEKELEKLEQRWDEQRRIAAIGQLQRQWRELDDRTAARHRELA